MISSDEVRRRFLCDLKGLLIKYQAEIQASDHYQGYPECGEDIRMIVTIPTAYNAASECVREFTEIDLGAYIVWDNILN